MEGRKKRKLDLSKENDVQEMMSLLETIDLDDEFLDNIESDEEGSKTLDDNFIDEASGDEHLEEMEDDTLEDDANGQNQHMSWCDTPQRDRNPFEFTGNSGVKFCLLDVQIPLRYSSPLLVET